MYCYIALARALDERMWVLQRAGKAMFVISGSGHEGCQVAAMWPMDKKQDWFVPYYRSVAACLVKGMTATDMLLGLFARATDPSSGGRQMPGHYGHPRFKILSTSSPVGTQYPHAVGIAYASKLRRTGEVTMVSIGEGGTSQGDWHEALNFAAIHKCPVLLIVENNELAISVPPRKQMAVESVAVRAAGYGMTGVTCWSVTAWPRRRTIAPSAARGRRWSNTASPALDHTAVMISRSDTALARNWSRSASAIPC